MPEIQGLRALAVALVVAFHLWPKHSPGGFVGVDVFFVISGFLITSHLLREVDRSGSIRLGSFYARRARRLLPASLLVLAVSGLAAIIVLPPQLARAALREVVASTFYVENLWLASKAVTYSASNDTASPVQHYWSLSTEEQFYALWPALILLTVWIAGRLVRRTPTREKGHPARGLVVGALSVLAIASLVHSITLTGADPAAAYFVTTTRVWEFAAGALTSFLVVRWAPRGLVAMGLRWIGFVSIVVTSFTISQATPFPGAVALWPVLGTAAIIVAGDERAHDPLIRLSSLRPVQWLGDVSYAVYLWHWPLIAFGPFLVARDLFWGDKLVILGITGLLAHLTRRFVEVPFITGASRLVGTPLRTLVSTVVAMSLIAGSALGYGAWRDHTDQAALQKTLAALASDPCLGAGAALDEARCGPPFSPPPRAPIAEADSPWAMPHCDPQCWSGDRPDKIIVLTGDSHAQTLYHALAPIAAAQGYEFALFLKGACPLNVVGRDRWQGGARDPQECGAWSADTVRAIRALRPRLVISSAYTGSSWSDPAAGAEGYHRTWREIDAPIVVVRDYPNTGGTWGPECLAKNAGDQEACSVPRGEALPTDVAYAAAGSAGELVSRVDLSDLYCDQDRCHPVVGTLPVYWDSDHISGTFARSLAPALALDIELP